jgi:transcriptional regulator with XRE-family HTH domain
MATNFGQRIRDERRTKRITLRSLANAMGWSAAYVSDIELGKRRPPATYDVIRIADILGVGQIELVRLASTERGSVRIETDNEGLLQVATGLARSGHKMSPEGLRKMLALIQAEDAK